MAFTTVPTVVAGSLATASWANTYVRDNINYLKVNMRPVSIQRGTVTFSAGATTATASISAVSSTAAAEISKLGDLLATEGTVLHMASLALTNTTTVTATRTSGSFSGDPIAGSVQYQVTEW